jgi:hypothetical protein
MFRRVLGATPSSKSLLAAIKAGHTIVWTFFVACILAVWVFAWEAEYFNAALSIAIVLIEVAVLFLNGLHCPLTPLAARYTDDRRANFDIYLPEWLAKHTKMIFGTLYVTGFALTLLRCLHETT